MTDPMTAKGLTSQPPASAPEITERLTLAR